jgi:hypothetical protein
MIENDRSLLQIAWNQKIYPTLGMTIAQLEINL